MGDHFAITLISHAMIGTLYMQTRTPQPPQLVENFRNGVGGINHSYEKASLRCTPLRFAMRRVPSYRFAWLCFTLFRCPSSCFAALPFASLASASPRLHHRCTSAALRFALRRVAWLHFASLRVASLPLASLRFASVLFASLRFASLRFASLRSA